MSWEFTPFVKVNFDTAISEDKAYIVIAAIGRNHKGELIFAFDRVDIRPWSPYCISKSRILGNNQSYRTWLSFCNCFTLVYRKNHSYNINSREINITEKLHFIILNYTSYYTLHHKLFECTFCTLNYDSYYTLHLDVKFAVNLDGNLKFRMKSILRSIVYGSKV